MRNEIEKLRDELRDLATIYGQEHAWGSQLVAMNCADRLQSILDADYVANPSQLGCSCLCHEQDPVSKLEAMGAAIIVDVIGDDLWWSYKGGDDENSELIGSIRITQQEIRDAATRLLARIEAKGE